MNYKKIINEVLAGEPFDILKKSIRNIEVYGQNENLDMFFKTLKYIQEDGVSDVINHVGINLKVEIETQLRKMDLLKEVRVELEGLDLIGFYDVYIPGIRAKDKFISFDTEIFKVDFTSGIVEYSDLEELEYKMRSAKTNEVKFSNYEIEGARKELEKLLKNKNKFFFKVSKVKEFIIEKENNKQGTSLENQSLKGFTVKMIKDTLFKKNKRLNTLYKHIIKDKEEYLSILESDAKKLNTRKYSEAIKKMEKLQKLIAAQLDISEYFTPEIHKIQRQA